MATPVLMPKQGITVESCFLSEWHVNEGDTVKVGTKLFSYETDKAAFDYDSEVEGVVLKILYEAGDIVDVLEPVIYIGEPGEEIDIDIELPVQDTPQTEDVKAVEVTQTQVVEPMTQMVSGEIFASPRAKNKAKKQNISLESLQGSGPEGRIIDRDVTLENVIIQTKPEISGAEFTMKPLSNMRRIIGKAMLHSLQTIAQLTHTLSFDATDMINYRKNLKLIEEEQNLPRITFNDMLVFALSRVLKDYPDLNAHFQNQTLKVFNHTHIGIAVDTERGLMVPTLFYADTLTLSEVSRQARELINASLAGNINPDLLTGGTFTVSNLGTLDIEHFTPIINPPQTGILGVNTITTQVKKDEYGRYVFYDAMGLSLTYDHQALDGADASRFLKDLKLYLESFSKKIEADMKGLK
ncbi:MAG: dihydrolipoamide acetyltransferase family protein [Acholeplasmataceae bacterium]|nr:2-oxo acid dehydrogenase subunit E2 [Acholeplasmataceae bacterium]